MDFFLLYEIKSFLLVHSSAHFQHSAYTVMERHVSSTPLNNNVCTLPRNVFTPTCVQPRNGAFGKKLVLWCPDPFFLWIRRNGGGLHLWPKQRRLDKVKDSFLEASWEYIACTQWATHRLPVLCVFESGLERTDFWICYQLIRWSPEHVVKRAYLLSWINVAVGKAFSPVSSTVELWCTGKCSV